MKTLTIYCFLAIILSSCKQETVLEGRWEEIESPYDIGLGGEKNTFTFEDNNFELKKFKWTDILTRDPCGPNFHNYHYSGKFNLINDNTLTVQGTLFKITYDSERVEINVPDCENKYGNEYKRTYQYKFRNDTLVLWPRNVGYREDHSLFNEYESIILKIINQN